MPLVLVHDIHHLTFMDILSGILHFKKENSDVPGTSLAFPLMLMVKGAEGTLALRQVVQKSNFFF